jgi:hypothetical protein
LTADFVFLHSWWRSGSTYIWSKLRDDKSFICYYEPLHERIAYLTLDVIKEPQAIKKIRFLRHPPQKTNYYSEYAALLRASNLRFSPSLSYDRFLLLPEQADEQLRVYIGGLIEAGSASGRMPVLCFCRSQMRSAWMKHAFGGIHIAHIRNPADQWASFNIESYFVERTMLIALNLRHSHPRAFAHIERFERFAQHFAKRPSLSAELISKFFVSAKDALPVYLIIWITSALQAVSCCDFVIDIDRLSTDYDSRDVASQRFASIGYPVDFSDCSIPISTERQTDPAFQRMIEEAVRAVRSGASSLVIANPEIVKTRLSLLSPLSRRVMAMALGNE